MSYSKGIMWLDDCRIPFVDEGDIDFNAVAKQKQKDGEDFYKGGFGKEIEKKMYKQQGRFTPNLLVSDNMLNDGVIGGNNSNKFYQPQYEDTSNIYGKYKKLQVSQYKDKGTNSRYYDLDLWFDKMLERL